MPRTTRRNTSYRINQRRYRRRRFLALLLVLALAAGIGFFTLQKDPADLLPGFPKDRPALAPQPQPDIAVTLSMLIVSVSPGKYRKICWLTIRHIIFI